MRNHASSPKSYVWMAVILLAACGEAEVGDSGPRMEASLAPYTSEDAGQALITLMNGQDFTKCWRGNDQFSAAFEGLQGELRHLDVVEASSSTNRDMIGRERLRAASTFGPDMRAGLNLVKIHCDVAAREFDAEIPRFSTFRDLHSALEQCRDSFSAFAERAKTADEEPYDLTDTLSTRREIQMCPQMASLIAVNLGLIENPSKTHPPRNETSVEEQALPSYDEERETSDTEMSEVPRRSSAPPASASPQPSQQARPTQAAANEDRASELALSCDRYKAELTTAMQRLRRLIGEAQLRADYTERGPRIEAAYNQVSGYLRSLNSMEDVVCAESGQRITSEARRVLASVGG